MLAVTGPRQGPWMLLHKASFILWFCAMAIHVLAYVPRLPWLLAAEARGVALPGAPSAGTRAPGGTPAGRWKSSAPSEVSAVA